MSAANDPNFLADRLHWEQFCLPMSERRVVLHYRRSFTAEQAERLSRGLIPQSMDDKWFAILRDDALDFYRSWSGHHIFRLHMRPTADGLEGGPLLVNGDPEEWSFGAEDAVEDVERLIERILRAG